MEGPRPCALRPGALQNLEALKTWGDLRALRGPGAAPVLMRCLVVIPAFNEEASLPAVLRELAACGYGFDVVVIDDCSRDRTAAVARAAGAEVLAHPRNLGYRHALRTGMRHALGGGYDALVFLDADGQHRPAAIASLLQRAAAADRPDVVIGSRYVGPRRYTGPLGRRLGRQAFSLLARGASALLRSDGASRIWDTTSGLKLLRRAALERLVEVPFCDLHAEAIVYLQAAGLRLAEVPVEIDERLAGESMYGWSSAVVYPTETLWAMARLMRQARRARR